MDSNELAKYIIERLYKRIDTLEASTGNQGSEGVARLLTRQSASEKNWLTDHTTIADMITRLDALELRAKKPAKRIDPADREQLTKIGIDGVKTAVALAKKARKLPKTTEAKPPETSYYDRAVLCVRLKKFCTVTLVQRSLKIGHPRAVRLVREMESKGIVGAPHSLAGIRRKVLPRPKSPKA